MRRIRRCRLGPDDGGPEELRPGLPDRSQWGKDFPSIVGPLPRKNLMNSATLMVEQNKEKDLPC